MLVMFLETKSFSYGVGRNLHLPPVPHAHSNLEDACRKENKVLLLPLSEILMMFPETNSLSSEVPQHSKIDKCILCHKIYECQLFLSKRHLQEVRMIRLRAFYMWAYVLVLWLQYGWVRSCNCYVTWDTKEVKDLSQALILKFSCSAELSIRTEANTDVWFQKKRYRFFTETSLMWC